MTTEETKLPTSPTEPQRLEAFRIASRSCVPHFDGDDFSALLRDILAVIVARDIAREEASNLGWRMEGLSR